MKVIHNRKNIIASIIGQNAIHTHEELASALAEKGIIVTQATLSRDIRDLGAFKSPEGCYQLPEKKIPSNSTLLQSIECSGQLCVVHTKPGFASAFATLVDSSSIYGVMGTLAGDDTIFIALKSDADESQIISKIKSLV